MKNILIFGKGYIGSNLNNYLASDSEKITVTCISRNELNYLDNKSLYNFFKLCAKKKLIFDSVINAVGFTGTKNIDDAEIEKDLCWLLNVIFPSQLVNIANQFDVTKIINISSGCIFNGGDTCYTEQDIPNFGLFNEDSSFYSKSKHAAELMLSHTYDNVFNIRIRMPFGEINSSRNLFQKLLKYDTLLNHANSVSYIYDVFNFIYNCVINDVIPVGIYNVVNTGVFEAKKFHTIALEHENELIKANLVKANHLKKVKIINLDEFNKSKLTTCKRSNVVLSNNSAVNALGAEFNTITDQFLQQILKQLIINSTNV
jgi:dTDP-4-dehydrorhamnose reductase